MTIEKLTELVKELARQHNELEKRMDLIGLASPGVVLWPALEARLKEKP